MSIEALANLRRPSSAAHVGALDATFLMGDVLPVLMVAGGAYEIYDKSYVGGGALVLVGAGLYGIMHGMFNFSMK